MEYKDELTGQAVTSSSDVTETGALIMNGNQAMIEQGSTAAVVPPVGTVTGQPQSAVTQVMSPSVEFGPSEPAQLPTTIHTTVPPVTSSGNWPPNDVVSQPCPPTDQLPCPLSSHVGQEVQQAGEAITADAQVCPGVQPELQHPEPVSTLSQNLQQNLIIAQPSAYLQSSTQQPVVHPTSTQQSAQQPQQPAGETITNQQLPAVTSELPEAPVNEAETTPPAALQQQHDIVSPGLQQTSDEVTSPVDIDLSAVDVYHPPVPETVVAEQPTGVPVAKSTTLQADDASQLAAVGLTDALQPTTSITNSGPDAVQHLPDTVTDQQRANVVSGFDDVLQNVVEPVQPQPTTTESTTLSAVESLPHSPDVAGVDLQQPPDAPAVGEVVISTTQPSGDVEPQLSSAVAADQHIQQAALPSELPVPSDVASLPLDSSLSTSPPAAAAQVGQELIHVGQPAVDIVDKQPADNKQVEMFPVEQPTTVPVSSSSELPLLNAVDSEPRVSPGQVGEIQQQKVIQVHQPTVDIVDKQPPHDDVVKATLNDVISAGSDTDDAPEVISDSLSRDRDATNEHDHQHPPVSHHCFFVISHHSSSLNIGAVCSRNFRSFPLYFS